MRRYQGLIMRRLIIFLSLLCFSSYSLATDKPTAYASCNAFYSSAHPIYQNSFSLGCQDTGTSFRPQQPSGSYDGSRYWSYTVSCDNSAQTYSTVTHLCGVTCPDGSTAATQEQCTVHCLTGATVSTSGSVQTLSWQTLDTSTTPNTCAPHSLDCTYPSVANAPAYACYLTCWDGSTVDNSAGSQCPPHPCSSIVNGNIITTRTRDPSTDECKNTGFKFCQSALEIPDAVSGDCLPKPGAIDCGGYVVQSPLKCVKEVDHSKDIVCSNGLIIQPPRVCSLLPPDPNDCPGGSANVQTTGYYNGVAGCIMKDGTTVAATGESSKGGTPDAGHAPPPGTTHQEYASGVPCTTNYAYACDPTLPKINLPVENCGPGTAFVCAGTNLAPELPVEKLPDMVITSETTKTNPDGSKTVVSSSDTPTTKTVVTDNPDGTTTTSVVSNVPKVLSDCPDCAKESTLREAVDGLGDIAKNLSSSGGIGNYSSESNTTGKGNFDDSIADAQAALDENKDALTAKMAEVKTGVSSLLSNSVSGGGGSLPTIDLGNMKGVNVSQDLNKFSPQLNVVGTIIIAMAWVAALSITLSR